MWFVIKRLSVLNKNNIYIENVVSASNLVKDITIQKNVIFCSCLMHFGKSNISKTHACIIYKGSNNWFAVFLILITIFAYIGIRISELAFFLSECKDSTGKEGRLWRLLAHQEHHPPSSSLGSWELSLFSEPAEPRAGKGSDCLLKGKPDIFSCAQLDKAPFQGFSTSLWIMKLGIFSSLENWFYNAWTFLFASSATLTSPTIHFCFLSACPGFECLKIFFFTFFYNNNRNRRLFLQLMLLYNVPLLDKSVSMTRRDLQLKVTDSFHVFRPATCALPLCAPMVSLHTSSIMKYI